MKTKRWAMLAGRIILLGLLLLVTQAVAEDVGETCGNVLVKNSDDGHADL